MSRASSSDEVSSGTPCDAKGRRKPVGDPTEVALVTLAIKGGLAPSELRARWPRQAEIPFDSGAKLMATQHATDGRSRVILKGAPEVLFGLCRAGRRDGEDVVLDDAARGAMQDAAERMAAQAPIRKFDLDP